MCTLRRQAVRLVTSPALPRSLSSRAVQLSQLPPLEAAKAVPATQPSFAGLPVSPALLSRVYALTGTTKPLAIQEASARRIFGGESVALHSQTGSGKTLAYLLPLLTRLRRDPVARIYLPRQALIVCPSRELAIQSCEYARRLQPGVATVVSGSRPDSLHDSLMSTTTPLVFLTSNQLQSLYELLAPDDEEAPDLGILPHVVRKKWYRRLTRLPEQYWSRGRVAPSDPLRKLRETLRTVVIDEADMVLHPKGKGGMRNRARRIKSLERLPAALAVRKLIGRDKHAAYPRIQLVLLSATLNRRSMRDVRMVADRRAGKIGLITPAMAELTRLDAGDASNAAIAAKRAAALTLLTEGGNAEDGAEDIWDLDAQLEAIAALEAGGMRAGVAAGTRHSAREQRAAALENGSSDAAAGVGQGVASGLGVRLGVLRQAVPDGISHEIVVCRERRKADVIASLLAPRPGPALVVVRDGLPMQAVLDELTAVGVDGAIELSALGTAAARFHTAPAGAGDGAAVEQGGGDFLAPVSVVDEALRSAGVGTDEVAEAAQQLPSWAIAPHAPTRDTSAVSDSIRGERWARRGDGVRRGDDGATRTAEGAEVAAEVAAEELGGGTTIPLHLSRFSRPALRPSTRAERSRRLGARPSADDDYGVDDADEDGEAANPVSPVAMTKKAREAARAAAEEEVRVADAYEERVQTAGAHHGILDASPTVPVVVAHESALRGLDMPHLRLVILTMMPETPESYIHVAGRTGRAGAAGRAVCVFTRREHDKAGIITAALQDVKWKVTYDDDDADGATTSGGSPGDDTAQRAEMRFQRRRMMRKRPRG